MLTVACYLWTDPASPHKDYAYGPEDVRLLKRMVDRHLTVPHEFVCITDNPDAFWDDEGIRAVPLDRTMHVPGRIFDKLMTFHPDAGRLIGERILVLDLDCVVVGNMDSLVSRTADLVLWRNPGRRPWDRPAGLGPKGLGPRRALYNTSMVLITGGARPDVWTRFEPDRERQSKTFDGDQDFVSHVVGPDCPYWDDADGVYRLARVHEPSTGVGEVLPDNARIVFFPGDRGKMWLPEVRARCPWIREHRH